MHQQRPCFAPSSVLSSLLLLTATLASPTSLAQTNMAFNAVADFSAVSNPSGPWSYGSRDSATGPYTPFSQKSALYGAGMSTWSNGSYPYVTHNGTGAIQPYQTVILPPDLLALHPGPQGEYAVVRWTAPATGTIQLDGRFQGLDRIGTTTNATITHKGVILFSQGINGFSARAPFRIQRAVTAGDTIEFSIGYGNSNYYCDTTGLSVTVNPVHADMGEASVPDDYFEAANPVGVWSYGSRPTLSAPFQVYAVHGSPYGENLDTWSQQIGSPPHVTHNRTTTAQAYSTFVLPPELLNLHPGPLGERSVVRWTAPGSGTVRVVGRFQGLDTAGTTSDAIITYNGAPLFNRPVNGYGVPVPFSIIKSVSAGDVIEFSVGYGSNCTYNNDSTGLTVSITPVISGITTGIEPSTSNPGGVWSYGLRASSGFVRYTGWSNLYGPSLLTWNSGGGGCCPHATLNLSSTPQTFSTFNVPAGFVNLHPGPNGERSVARWTAPATATVRIKGRFQGLDSTTTDVAIQSATSTLFTGAINGMGSTAPFSLTVLVNRGDFIEFSVGRGSNGTYFNDSTGLTVTITEPAVVGAWSTPMEWPFVAIHSSVLPQGKVLAWTRREGYTDAAQGGTQFRLWDPATNTLTALPAPPNAPSPSTPMGTQGVNDLFCSGHAFLPNGQLLVAGGTFDTEKGTTNTNLFEPTSSSWSTGAPLNAGRWYPTACALANGEMLVLGLEVSAPPQVWQTGLGGGWRTLSGGPPKQDLQIYNWLHLAPNGQVFHSGPDNLTRYLDTAGTGTWTHVAKSIYPYRDYGSSAMYADGRVLIVGGGPPTHTAEVIDLGAATPTWRYVGAMANARRHLNLTLLPDGQVLATGGTSGPGYDSQAPVLAAELWDPASESWSTLASMRTPRLYHSTAVLLPDGRVLCAGGGQGGSPPVPDQPNAEIYSPPYLFQSGSRPVITSAPASVHYGQSFFVGSPDVITQVTWLRLSSVTHGFNMNQRINRLNFSTTSGGLNVTAPTDANLAPPGHYMLFLLNSSGVPSIAKVIQLQ
jgi:hypothetical protein